MFKSLYTFIIFTIFCHHGFTKIPDIITDYLNRNKEDIDSDVFYQYNTKERDLIVERMAEKLITRYQSSQENSATVEKELKNEIIQYIASNIINQNTSQTDGKPKKVFHSEQKNDATNKEVAERILKTYPGSFEGKILRINYKESPIPLKVKTSSGINITLPGIQLPLPNTLTPFKQCLNLKFMPTSSIYDIEWLGALETVCPLPVEKGQGAYLLGLAEDIARALAIPHLRLSDSSEVLCVKDLEKASLRLLRVWEKKESWYESQGYTPATPEIAQLLEKERKELNTLTLKDFQAALHEINSTEKPIFIEKLEEFRKVPQLNSSYLATFMAWLWPYDCAAYNALFRLLKSYNNKLDDDILIDDDIWLKKNL